MKKKINYKSKSSKKIFKLIRIKTIFVIKFSKFTIENYFLLWTLIKSENYSISKINLNVIFSSEK